MFFSLHQAEIIAANQAKKLPIAIMMTQTECKIAAKTRTSQKRWFCNLYKKEFSVVTCSSFSWSFIFFFLFSMLSFRISVGLINSPQLEQWSKLRLNVPQDLHFMRERLFNFIFYKNTKNKRDG